MTCCTALKIATHLLGKTVSKPIEQTAFISGEQRILKTKT